MLLVLLSHVQIGTLFLDLHYPHTYIKLCFVFCFWYFEILLSKPPWSSASSSLLTSMNNKGAITFQRVYCVLLSPACDLDFYRCVNAIVNFSVRCKSLIVYFFNYNNYSYYCFAVVVIIVILNCIIFIKQENPYSSPKSKYYGIPQYCFNYVQYTRREMRKTM